MSHTLTMEVSEDTLAALRLDPAGFMAELRLAGAAKLYELGQVSQERGAEIAGLDRRDFIAGLSRYGVSPFQYTMEEIGEELARG